MPIQLFPLAGGLNQHIDSRLLPDGALANAVNVEFERQGRLVGRAKYTAQAATVYGAGTLTAYDLFTLNGRLFCLGDASSYSFPSDIFEYLPDGTAARWRPTSIQNASSPRLPRATKVRDLARPPDNEGGISNMGCAAVGGYACLVWNASDDTTVGYALIVDAEKNQPLRFAANQAVSLLRVLALSDRFLFLGLLSNAMVLARFIPASDEAEVVITATLVVATISTYACAKVAGSDEFVVAYNVAGTITIKRYSNAGVEQVPSGGAYANITAAATRIAIEASSSANQLVVILNVSGTTTIYGYNLSTGASIGDSVACSGETVVEVGLVRTSSSVVKIVASVTSETAPTVFTQDYTVATDTLGSVVRAVTDAQLTTSPVLSSEVFFGVRIGDATVGNTPNMLVSTGGSRSVTPQIVKNLETADTESSLLPDIAYDSSTGKYYWANATASADGASTPQLTEFELSSTDRRQTASFGNHVYLGGGCPLIFDGVTVCESGFCERPRIISLTASNSTGTLLSGAEYDYRVHWEWIDSNGDLHISPPSKISSVTLGASDDTVTAVVTSPHSMRRNISSPTGAVACVLSRTLATVSNTAAVVTGEASIDPPSGSLNGLTLLINAGGTNYTVTFTGAATTKSAILSEINTVVSAEVTATAPDGLLVLTSVDTGDGAVVEVRSSGTANTILGFAGGAISTGETTYTKGENFQRTAVEYTANGDAAAAYVSIVDTRKDESDPIVDTDLIRQGVLYSQGNASGGHHAPPPADYVTAGRERIAWLGQPNRSRWSQSKLIVGGEPAEAAAEGVVAFSGLIGGDIEAGYLLGDSLILFTGTEIWVVTGTGPNRAGQGEFSAAERVSKSLGLIEDGWRSLVEDDEGLWFQGSDGELYRIGKGGAVEWAGRAVQDYLEDYPVIVAATVRQKRGEVCFAVTDANGSTGGILRMNPGAGDAPAWFFDDVGAVSALAEYEGRLAYVQSGTVYLQDASPGSGTFPTYYVDSGLFQGFQALGYGQLKEVGFLGTFRDDCTVTIKLSTDGETFSTTLGAWSLTTSEYSAGQRVQLTLQPAQMEYDSFALRLEVSHAGGDSEGVWLHAFALDTENQPDFVRLAPSRRL